MQAQRVVLATNAYPPLLRRLRLMTVPVYDYALMTEPLTPAQRASIGWEGREGIGDAGNQFHYFRTTRDGRILWGGYDAIYHYASGISAEYDERPETFEVLAEHFFATFPQLVRARGSPTPGAASSTPAPASPRSTAPRWPAASATPSASPAWAWAPPGSPATSCSTSSPAQDTPRTRLEMVRKKPVPFPPEPFRWVGIEATRRSLARADANGGRENLWLKAMDKLGLGFDS